MKCRFIREVGTRGVLRVYWEILRVTSVDVCCAEHPEGRPSGERLKTCPNSYGMGKPGALHNAYAPLGNVPELGAFQAFGLKQDVAEERWPKACAHCGAPVPASVSTYTVGAEQPQVTRQISTERLYDSPSGKPERGDVYRLPYHDAGDCPFWDNCDGVHLYAMLPNGDQWDIDSRCSNCTMKGDRTHRCWVQSGSPEAGTLTVGKGGHTCAAGGGSILVDGYHGFLQGFAFT